MSPGRSHRVTVLEGTIDQRTVMVGSYLVSLHSTTTIMIIVYLTHREILYGTIAVGRTDAVKYHHCHCHRPIMTTATELHHPLDSTLMLPKTMGRAELAALVLHQVAQQRLPHIRLWSLWLYIQINRAPNQLYSLNRIEISIAAKVPERGSAAGP